MSGGVDVVAPDGTAVDFLETGGVPLNCVFHEGDLLITDFGDITEVGDDAPMEGRLWRVAVGVEGMPLFRGSIARR
jgi:gluconolactonase